jgi:hypothetical protein
VITKPDLLESIINALSVLENPQNDTRIVKIGYLLMEKRTQKHFRGGWTKLDTQQGGKHQENLNPVIFP